MIAITSRENPHIKAAVRLRVSAAERCALGKFFLEGFRLCADALESGYAPDELYLTAAAREKYGTAPLERAAGQVFEVSEGVARKLADTQHPQGVFAVCGGNPPPVETHCCASPDKKAVFRSETHSQKEETHSQKEETHSSASLQTGGKYIALENLQDPGNLGAVARTAEALGLDGLIAGSGCDPYHPKALRVSMGALLRLPVLRTDDLPAALRESALPCYAAVPDRDAQSVAACDFRSGGIVVIGSEGHGLTPEAIAACEHRITIPMAGRAESFNAAAAATILMWEMVRGSAAVRYNCQSAQPLRGAFLSHPR